MKNTPIIIPWLGPEEAEAAGRAILSGWVTQGPRVAGFEAAFAGRVGAPCACAVSSCTTALHLALLAVGVRPGDVVVTVSHSFIATANAVRHCSAEPVFVDVEPATGNMDPARLAECLEQDCEVRDGSLWYGEADRLAADPSPLAWVRPPLGRVAAILAVHQAGMPADLGRILPLAARHGLPVVEDAACAAGSELRLLPDGLFEPVGRPHGAAACFSFHPRKLLTTGDGGMLTTADPALDASFRLLRQHGMSVSDLARHAASRVVFEEYVETGFNYRMTDIQAAVGLEQLKRLGPLLARRRMLAARYAEALDMIPGVEPPQEPDHARTNWQSYIVRLEDPVRQRGVMDALLAEGVVTRRGIMCAHLERPYSRAWPPGSLPASEAARDSGLILPLYHQMGEEDVMRVCAALGRAVRR